MKTGSGTFTEGDKVGLYIYGSPSRHVILTLENGRWTPALKKSDLGSGTARLSAYYPVSEAEGIGSNVHRHKGADRPERGRLHGIGSSVEPSRH